MTRKEALQIAISALQNNHREVAGKLQEILEDMPLNRWSKAAIHDALQQFTVDYGRHTTVSDLKSRNMPPHPCISLRFGMTAKQFLDAYYSQRCCSIKYRTLSEEDTIKIFKGEYERIKPSCENMYNTGRGKNTPAIHTICCILRINTLAELLKYTGVVKYDRRKNVVQQPKQKLNIILDGKIVEYDRIINNHE